MSSLPATTIAQLSEENLSRKMKSDEYIRELESALERQKETIESLELAVKTMRRRLETLEGVT